MDGQFSAVRIFGPILRIKPNKMNAIFGNKFLLIIHLIDAREMIKKQIFPNIDTPGEKSKGSITLGNIWLRIKSNLLENDPISVVRTLSGYKLAINFKMNKLVVPAKK